MPYAGAEPGGDSAARFRGILGLAGWLNAKYRRFLRFRSARGRVSTTSTRLTARVRIDASATGRGREGRLVRLAVRQTSGTDRLQFVDAMIPVGRLREAD